MKNWQRIAATLFIFFIVIIGSTVALLKSRLVPESIELMVIPRLEELVRQPISYTGLTIGYWGTVTIKDVSVGGSASQGEVPLLRCRDVVLHCPVIPLLTGRIAVERVILLQPRITVRRDEQGNYNFMSQFSPRGKKTMNDSESGVFLRPVYLDLKQLLLKDGVITVKDYSHTATRPFSMSLEQINLAVATFSLVSPFPLSFSAKVPSNPPLTVSFDASVDPLHREIEATLEFQPEEESSQKTRLEGSLALEDQGLTIKQFKAVTGESSLSLKGALQDLGSTQPSGHLEITSPALRADDLVSCLKAVRSVIIGEQEDAGNDGSGKPPYPENLSVDAELTLDKIRYRNMLISGVKANCSLKDTTLNLTSLRGKVGEGTIQSKGFVRWEMAEPEYGVHFRGDGLQLVYLISALSPDFRGNIDGVAGLSVNLSGSGMNRDALKEHLSGEGSLRIKDCRVSGLEVLQSLTSFIKVDKLGTLVFEQGQGTFTVADGLIRTAGSLTGRDVEIYPEGTVNLDSYLNLSLQVRIAPSLSDQVVDGVLTKYFKDESGWTVISLEVKGPPGEIVLMPASSTINNISDMLVDILFKEEKAGSGDRQDKKKTLEGLLKRLLQKSKEE